MKTITVTILELGHGYLKMRLISEGDHECVTLVLFDKYEPRWVANNKTEER